MCLPYVTPLLAFCRIACPLDADDARDFLNAFMSVEARAWGGLRLCCVVAGNPDEVKGRAALSDFRVGRPDRVRRYLMLVDRCRPSARHVIDVGADTARSSRWLQATAWTNPGPANHHVVCFAALRKILLKAGDAESRPAWSGVRAE
jgi:hypothetical protein